MVQDHALNRELAGAPALSRSGDPPAALEGI